MKIKNELRDILSLTYNGFGLNFSSESLKTDYIIHYDNETKKIIVEYSLNLDYIYKTKEFDHFRNGDKESPCLENFLEKWVATVNADDIELCIL